MHFIEGKNIISKAFLILGDIEIPLSWFLTIASIIKAQMIDQPK